MKISKAVIAVAGYGTRFIPATKVQPKEMLPVGHKPVVQYVVEELHRCGVRRLLFVTGPGKTAIENHFDVDAELIAAAPQLRVITPCCFIRSHGIQRS